MEDSVTGGTTLLLMRIPRRTYDVAHRFIMLIYVHFLRSPRATPFPQTAVEIFMLKLSTMLPLGLFMLPLMAQAQIPNPGFEDWTGTEPDGWVDGNIADLGVYPVTKTADAHSGNWALKGTIVIVPQVGFNESAFIQSGPGGNGFPVTARSATVTGYYKCSLLSGDMLGLNFAMYQGASAMAVGAQIFAVNTSTWTPFTVTFNYFAPGVPDNANFQVQIIGPGTGADYHLGSWYEIDDLAFGAPTTALPGVVPLEYSLDQNYPNPFNPATTIRYTVAHRTHVTLAVFNTLGERVALLADEVQEPGVHEARFNAGGIASGVYFYRLQATGFVATRRLELLR